MDSLPTRIMSVTIEANNSNEYRYELLISKEVNLSTISRVVEMMQSANIIFCFIVVFTLAAKGMQLKEVRVLKPFLPNS